MATAVGVLKGVVAGIGGATALGVATCAGCTVVGWPEDGLAFDRSRHLAEAIAEGMSVAMTATFVLVPLLTLVFVRRSRR